MVINMDKDEEYIKDEIRILPDFYVKLLGGRHIKFTEKKIKYINRKYTEDAESISDLIMSNYREYIEKSENFIDNYLQNDSNKLDSENAIDLIKTFSEELCKVHPYFSAELRSPLEIKIEYKQKNSNEHKEYTESLTAVQPWQYLVVEQLMSDIAIRLKNNSKNIEDNQHIMEAYMKPIVKIVYKWFDYESENSMLNDLKNELHERSNRQLYERRYQTPAYSATPLGRIKEALDNLKTFVYVLVSPNFDRSKIDDAYFMDKFISCQSSKLQENYRKITMKMNFKSKPSPPGSYEDFSNKLEHLTSKISENKMDIAFKNLDVIYDMINDDVEITYEIHHFEQLMYIYLKFLLHQKINLKICRNCKNLFKPGHYNEKYCSEPIEGLNGKTCRDIGAAEAYEKDEFNRELKKINSYFAMKIKRMENFDYSTKCDKYQDAFEKWKQESKIIKIKYRDEIKKAKHTQVIYIKRKYADKLREKFQEIINKI